MEIGKECEQYLVEYYQGLFFRNVNKRYRAMTGAELRKRLSWLTEANLKPLVKSNEFSDVHATLSRVCAHLMRREGHLTGPVLGQWEFSCRQMREFCEILVRKDLEYVNGLSRGDLEQMLEMQGICRYLFTNSLERAYQLFYIPKTIKRDVPESIKQRSEQEYPEAREIKHMFILYAGLANNGKIRDALERLKGCRHGAYFGPLRLLTLEVYDKPNIGGLSCSMVTREETLGIPGAACQSYTVGMLNDHEYLDIVVMDECWMITNPYREHSWIRAALGLRAEGIHLHMVPETEDIVVQMIKRRNDRYRVARHERNIRLIMKKKPYNPKRDLKKGNALVVFSKKSVLVLVAHLENEGIHCSVVYGDLPPAIRREQARRFPAREAEVAASTNAIDMGLNLPIRRIAFVETRKFDGVNKRTLNPEGIEQIVERTGRHGPYNEGFMAAIDEAEVIENSPSRIPTPIMEAYVGFPGQPLNLPTEIDTLVKIWAGMDMPSIYEKMEVGKLLALYMSFEHVHRDDMEEYSRREIYKLITCSTDIDNRMVMNLWRDYCREHHGVTELGLPYSPGGDLYELEGYYKMLNLCFQSSRKVGLPVQVENLAEERHGTEREISRILRTECTSYTRRCSVYGKELSWDHPFSVCGRCLERGKINQGHSRSGWRHVAGNRV